MSQDTSLPQKPSLTGVSTDMDDDCHHHGSYFSLGGNEKSVVEMPALPAWMINTPMHSKLPVIDAPKGKYVLFTTGLCEKLDCSSSSLDFDASPQTISVEYKSLHDPHLKWHYNSTAVYKRLVKNGFITSDGKVICTLKEFNDYHQYLKQIRLSKIKQERKRMLEEKQKEKRKIGVKNKENENIRDIRTRNARERKKKQEEDKEARLNEMLSIETLRFIRLEEKIRLKQKHQKTSMKMAQERRNELKAQQIIEEKKRKTKFIRKRSIEDKRRSEKLERSHCTKREEREAKLEKKWILRERLHEMRLLSETEERKARQLIMAKNISEREALVEQMRTRQRGVFKKIQEDRVNQLKAREQLLSKALDIKLKKIQERFQKRNQKVPRPKAANSSRRSRFSSTWSLERTLKSHDLQPCDDSWIQKLKGVKCDETADATEPEDIQPMESHGIISKTSTQSSVSSTRADISVTDVDSRKASVTGFYTVATGMTEESPKHLPKSVDSIARGLICDVLQTVAEEEGYDGYYLSPRISPAESDNDVVNRSFVRAKTTDGGSDGEDDWYAAANNIVGQAIDGAIGFLENNPELIESSQSGTLSAASEARDNIRRQSIILSSVINMMDDTGLDLHYVSSSEDNATDDEDEGDDDVIGIIDNTGSSTNGDGDWQVEDRPEQSPVPSANNTCRPIGSRRRSINEAILAPDTLRGFHELEADRATSSLQALRLGGSMRRLAIEERSIQRRHTVPDIVPIFNDVQLNIDKNTIDSNLCAISVKPNTFSQVAHTPIERNSFRNIFKPDMTLCKGTADALRGVLTQQLSQRRASLRSGDIEHACDVLVENPDEESHHQEDVVSVEETGGFCYLPKRTHYRHSKLDEISEKVTEEAIEEEDKTQEISDEELEIFAQQMVADVLNKLKNEVAMANQTASNEGENNFQFRFGDDGVRHTNHEVHTEVINGTDDKPVVVVTTVSARKNVNDVEWYEEWLPGPDDIQNRKSVDSRTSKRTKSREHSTIARSSKKKRNTSSTSRLSKRSTSAKSFKEALRSNSSKTRVVSSEPIKATALTSDESGSSVNSRVRRRSESFISRFVSSVRDFFTSSKHKAEAEDDEITVLGDASSDILKDCRIKSEEIIETIICDSKEGTPSIHNDFESIHSEKDAKECTEVKSESASNEQSRKQEVNGILTKHPSQVSELGVNKRASDFPKVGHKEAVVSESGAVKNGTMSPGNNDQTQEQSADSKPNLNDDSRISESSKTSCISVVGTKNEITTEDADAIRNALQPSQNIETTKPSKTPPSSSARLKEEECSQVEGKPSQQLSTPRPPSKKRETASSSSLRRSVGQGSSHRKVKSEVTAMTEKVTSSRNSYTRQHSVPNIKRDRRDSDSNKKESHFQSFSSHVPNNIGNVASENIPLRSRKSSSRRSSYASSDDGVRKLSMKGPGACSNTKKSSNHRGSALSNSVQSRTSLHNNAEGSHLDIKKTSKDGVNVKQNKNDSSTGFQSGKSSQGSALTCKVRTRKSLESTHIEGPTFDVKTTSESGVNNINDKNSVICHSTKSLRESASNRSTVESRKSSNHRPTHSERPDNDGKKPPKDDVNTTNVKKDSSTSCLSKKSQILAIETETVTNSTELDVSESLNKKPVPSLTLASITKVSDTAVKGMEESNFQKKSEELGTATIDNSTAQKVENVGSTSSATKSPSGRLLSRPQSDENRLRLVSEADIASSEITNSVLSTVSNLPEISQQSSAEIVLNTLTDESKSLDALEQDRPKAPEPPISGSASPLFVNQDSLVAISPKQSAP
ncbi:uncharacterized protein LOC117102876 [Anneissia japonica]|uniref:uncharacterized protein LOC117102876 n=1 Tax=Anneissia japonica TaxID=1529436 RepID=UPI001425A48A|nr:uncharacterized protein LOC117102876 [Anneissia japonica]